MCYGCWMAVVEMALLRPQLVRWPRLDIGAHRWGARSASAAEFDEHEEPSEVVVVVAAVGVSVGVAAIALAVDTSFAAAFPIAVAASFHLAGNR